MEFLINAWGWIGSTFTLALFTQYYPTLLNGISLTCAYCLNNHKVTLGRWFGVTAAIGWSSYGVLIDDYSFFIANLIFLWIYASALYKFNRKRNEYKATFEDMEEEIANLKKQLNREKFKKNRAINSLNHRKEKEAHAKARRLNKKDLEKKKRAEEAKIAIDKLVASLES